ncbi:LVIVD repeat-containing protein [Chitinophaga sp. GbtcB8]|uniref:LVIVD repeat-containing protein n=1 Tax=Chitinophaga sp. GbtcB8 TaxID=2824753 RepID=UPI001C3011DB|nr:hypothetical protein [Chitinophaga sp. GbtcB8]
MRSVLYKLLMAACLVAAMLTIAGCQKDDYCNTTYRYTIYTPVYESLKNVRASFKSEGPQPIETAGKIYLYGKYIFLNELNKGIHIIDNSNPSAPNNVAFINIPGNVDMAVNGNILYADSYMDLLAVDISNPLAAKESNRVQDVFPQRVYNYYAFQVDSTHHLDSMIVDFKTRDTVVKAPCTVGSGPIFLNDAMSFALNASSAGKSSVVALGKGGSTARFALVNNYLYTVGTWSLQVFGIQNAAAPVKQVEVPVTGGLETIFPFNGSLLIGSTSGMFIYDASEPTNLKRKGAFGHINSCDPVVAENTTAYVTLRGGTPCGSFTNQLDVLDIKDMTNPTLIKTYPMSSPYGLGIDGKRLFICEGTNGLRFMDASDPQNIRTLRKLENIEAYDVIPTGKILLVTAKDGLYQYDYSSMAAPKFLSRINMTTQH